MGVWRISVPQWGPWAKPRWNLGAKPTEADDFVIIMYIEF